MILGENLAGDQWLWGGLYPEVGEITLEDMLVTYAQHGEDHLDPIARALG